MEWFSGGGNLAHAALLTYDGTNYHTVVSSDGIAPGSNGAAYGIELVPGSIDDSGDVNFAAVPTGINSTTFYIVPFGETPVRIVGLSDNPPPSSPAMYGVFPSWFLKNWLERSFPGALIFGNSFVPGLNSHGQMLLSLWGGLFIGSKDGTFSLVPMATSGACSPQPITTGTTSLAVPWISGFLNDNGVVAYTNPSSSGSATICVASPGGSIPTASHCSWRPGAGERWRRHDDVTGCIGI